MLDVAIISPERIVFEGQASQVVAPAHDGEVGILPQHAPLMTLLGKGTLRLVGASGAAQEFEVAGGFLQVIEDRVRVVTEAAKGKG
ncbi:MAG: F0F1 ATP synthase subunit epsilon [Gemmatimonadaceae bacterium]|jgi:F-type H+-transporting ATPase subunit epsilon|nr:F0F1 ATP synthase subunit epsilon [Gemmatimonadaceae bacterium]